MTNRSSFLFWFLFLVFSNLIVGWSAFGWNKAAEERKSEAQQVKNTTLDQENRELQDIVASLRQNSADFVLQAKSSDDGGLRFTINPAKPLPSFALRTPARWGITGLSEVSFIPEGETKKIVSGYLITPHYSENIDIPYDPTLMIWVVKAQYENDPGVTGIAGERIAGNSQYAYLAHTRINNRRECKNNDKICRETKTQFDAEAVELYKSFVILQ
jgi:hypothetical protein